MSSVIKKTTHFVPKLKKPGIKKKLVKKLIVTNTSPSPAALETPPPTQADEYNNSAEHLGSLLANELNSYQPVSPVATQQQSNDSQQSRFSVKPTTPSSFQPIGDNEDEVDPKDTSKVDEQSLKPHNEGELFKATADVSRRSSVAQRRLSGITPAVVKNRSGSISTDSEAHVPAKIGIPVAKAKRRRSSVARSKRAASVLSKESAIEELLENDPVIISTTSLKPAKISIPSRNIVREPSPDQTRETTPTNSLIAALRETDAEYVVGIDPRTNKLSKFRLRSETSTPVSVEHDLKVKLEQDLSELPLAPDDLVTSIQSVRQLPRSVDDSDVQLYSEVSLDINNMTMAELCKPTLPFGRVSANFESVKAAQKTISDKRKQRRQDRLTAREQRISLVEVARINGTAEVEDEEAEEEARKKRKANDLEAEEDAPVSSSLQLMIAPDGKISYDTDSAVVSRHSRLDNSSLSREISNPFENPVTSFTYSKRSHTDRWTTEEVEQFYEALSMLGTDFSLISQMFPYRTRKQIKSKFNLEEKKYPEIIAIALKRKLPADFKDYCTASKKDIKSMEFYNEQLKQVRVQHEAHMALIQSERERAYKEDAEASRRREIEIRTGAKPMTRSEKIKELRKNQEVVGSIDEIKKNK